MGIFSFLTTTPKVVDVGLDLAKQAANGIDALFFTAEEKSKASLQAIELWIKTQEIIRDEGSARSITRRVLAVMILSFTLILGLATCAIWPYNAAWAVYLLAVLKEFGFMTGAVTVFYFGYYGFQQIVGKK